MNAELKAFTVVDPIEMKPGKALGAAAWIISSSSLQGEVRCAFA